MDSQSEDLSRYDIPANDTAPSRSSVADAIGADERRMHVRAYNHWCALLDGRDFPSIQDLQATDIEDFSSHSVLLNFAGAMNDPATPFVGEAIRAEIGVDKIARISDVPGRSLLSRLTDHHFQIIATRAPVGFEADFINQRGHEISYRGILMPFSSDGRDIDYVYGVINWKDNGLAAEVRKPLRAVLPPIVAEREDEQEILDMLAAEERLYEERIGQRDKTLASMALSQADALEASHPAPRNADWDDGAIAGASDDDEEAAIELDEDAGLADRLCAARATADVCKAADGRSRAALYRALAMAYDFAVAARRVPDDYAEILDDAGVKAQARAPMTPIVKLVFGADYDKTRLTEFASALSNATREDVAFGGFEAFVEACDGGLKGLVAAERKARRPERVEIDRATLGKQALRSAPPIALADLPTNEEFALVLTRRNADGRHEVVQLVSDAAMLDRALRRAAG
ncbi:MAG: hypothetical protein M3R03_01955 [Pseudomonadota bacterium]|nr:hypothetical protein [Pseudomonadota bacterium]